MLKFLTFTISLLYLNCAIAQDNKIAKSENSIDTKAKKIELINQYKKQINNMTSSRFKQIAEIQILNKNTAKTQIANIKAGESFRYGNIIITSHRCWQAPLTQKPDSKILLEVDEINLKNENETNNIFLGWMIASSPSISGLEHPIYDITALNCKDE